MDCFIAPLKGVGDLGFGTLRDEVRKRIGSGFRSFRRSPQAASPCDYFENKGAFFYYDSDDRLEAVEFVSPSRPSIAGVELLGLGFEEAYIKLRALDDQIAKEVDGAIAYQLGVSIYAPLAKGDSSAPVESVIAFRPGYYN